MTSLLCVGIDYSLCSPAITVHVGAKWDFKNCQFYFLTQTKKLLFDKPPFHPEWYPEYLTQEERIDLLSEWALSKIPKEPAKIVIENYAFAAKNVQFTLGENTGNLKHKLFKRILPFELYSPGTFKKLATGKGNALKEDMHYAFVKETKCDILSYVPGTLGKSPLSDIIDSYYICKYAFLLCEKK